MGITDLRVGHGHDIHALSPGHQLWLGGIHVTEAEAGFDTHSDGDVLSHAIIDALAGAMADGDLGTHYPENDPDAEDARSVEFLREFCRYVRSQGYEIINLDSFVTLGTTRLQPRLRQIRESVAEAMELPLERVSVKGRSHDGLGDVGEGRAASGTATVLLNRTTASGW